MAKAAQNAGSIRQQKNGKWEARVTIGTDPGTGKPIRRSIYGDTWAAVRKEMTAILRNLDKGTYQAPEKVTAAQWMEEWLSTFCSNKVKPLTLQSYQGIAKNHIAPAIGSRKLQAVKGTHILQLYDGGWPVWENY